MGHFTLGKVWKDKHLIDSDDNDAIENTSFYEINLDPRYFSRDVIDIIGTLLHEMVHYYNKANGIKDCSGQNHNKKFKVAAENVDLIVEKGDSVGWGYTSVSDELRKFIENEIQPDSSVFDYFHSDVIEVDKPRKKRKKNIFKYTCPMCGMEVKGKRDSKIKCGDCEAELEMEDIEDEDIDDDSSDS